MTVFEKIKEIVDRELNDINNSNIYDLGYRFVTCGECPVYVECMEDNMNCGGYSCQTMFKTYKDKELV